MFMGNINDANFFTFDLSFKLLGELLSSQLIRVTAYLPTCSSGINIFNPPFPRLSVNHFTVLTCPPRTGPGVE
ncbi:MAG: hypothetical protein HJJLKODD_02517 [Phycisphaerae bacterium]|nr:hypothetical protein [Phycisphaerae bacterium]